MISIAVLLLVIAFYLFYNTSERAVKHHALGFEDWASQYPLKARISGLFMFIIVLSLLLILFGTASGTMLFFILLMTVGSSVIILTPLKLISRKSLGLLFIISLSTELISYFF